MNKTPKMVVQKRIIEFQIDQSHLAKQPVLPNVISQFMFHYYVFGTTTEIYDTGSETCRRPDRNLVVGYLLVPNKEDATRVLGGVGEAPVDVLHQDVHLV